MTNDAKLLSIRFWWGFKRKDLPREMFLDKLANVFLPATVQVMSRRLGALTGYLPVVPPDHGCFGVPDELALVVYRSIEEYEAASASVEGRAYHLLHDAVFDRPSSSNGFAERFDGNNLENGQPYFLWSTTGDWMEASCSFLLGRRPRGVSKQQFVDNVTAACRLMSSSRGEKTAPDTVLIRMSTNVVSYCEMWTGDSIPNGRCFNLLAESVTPVMRQVAAPQRVPFDFNTRTGWLSLSNRGEFLNLQF